MKYSDPREDINSQYFSAEQIKNGEMNTFLTCLMDQAYGKGRQYNDIHIVPEDCGAFIIEWVQVPWSHEWGGRFQYVDEDQQIFTEYCLPDGTTQYCCDDEEWESIFSQWLKDHPQWQQNEYGIWFDSIENEKWIKELRND